MVTSAGGTAYLALRPLLSDYVLSMPRGAQVIYPKDAAQIVAMGDIFPGAKVLEAGAGSGALTCSLLRAVGAHGELHSYELREDFAAIAAQERRGVLRRPAPGLDACTSATSRTATETGFDRIILDMLTPWEMLDLCRAALIPGGVFIGYVATTPQLSELVEALRERGGFTEPRAWESLVRDWHAEGLAVRPDHRMIAHTAFLISSRRLAPGVTAPPRRRKPSKGAEAYALRKAAQPRAASDRSATRTAGISGARRTGVGGAGSGRDAARSRRADRDGRVSQRWRRSAASCPRCSRTGRPTRTSTRPPAPTCATPRSRWTR